MKKQLEVLSSLQEINTYIIKEGKFTIRELCYHSVNNNLLFTIRDFKTTFKHQILGVISMFTNTNILTKQQFIAHSSEEKELFTIIRNRGLNDHFSIYCQEEKIAEIKGSTKLKFNLNVTLNNRNLGTVTGGSGWWTFDSPEGKRYIDYKKDSYIPEYKHSGKFLGPSVLKVSNMRENVELMIISLALPYIIEIIYLNQQT
ncbi:hypothetical protein [Thalassobacillus hwangdonensis]|uniref:Uncharacterized protein n=1 Tax=Thalassobacillus hwangdonensis TaxID=546108 RepID=A0ABW3L0E5_9BACI